VLNDEVSSRWRVVNPVHTCQVQTVITSFADHTVPNRRMQPHFVLLNFLEEYRVPLHEPSLLAAACRQDDSSNLPMDDPIFFTAKASKEETAAAVVWFVTPF
jgi:hypothetical protein